VDGGGGGGVVAAERREGLVAAGVAAGHAGRVLDGLGAGVGEEHTVHAGGGDLGDQPGGLGASGVGVRRVDGRQFGGLVLDGLDHHGVLTADAGVDPPCGEVGVLVAVPVPPAAARGGGGDH